MKHLIIIIFLLLPSSTDEADKLSQLEIEIVSDNPNYFNWSYSEQEKVKSIYIKYHY